MHLFLIGAVLAFLARAHAWSGWVYALAFAVAFVGVLTNDLADLGLHWAASAQSSDY